MSSVLAGPDRAVDHTPRHPDDAASRIAVGSSDPCRVGVLEAQVASLTRARQSRDVIGQAKGILVAHYGISADEAFALLARLSQHTNTKLAGLAPAVVAGVRARGPAHPAQCQVVTEVLEGLLAGTERAASH